MAKVSPVSIDRRTATEKKAVQLRSLHKPGDPLILVNVWDAASARVIAALPEVKAVGTTSWAISAALGVPDGENLTADEALYTAGIVVTSVDLPVTVDLERGYGRTADDVGATVSRLIMIGAVGCNLEDSLSDSEVPGGEGPGRHASAASGAPARGGRGMRPISEQVERLQAARDSGKAVLLVSLELDEIMNVSDRIAVMYEGEIVAEVQAASATAQELGLYMSGASRQDQQHLEEVAQA